MKLFAVAYALLAFASLSAALVFRNTTMIRFPSRAKSVLIIPADIEICEVDVFGDIENAELNDNSVYLYILYLGNPHI